MKLYLLSLFVAELAVLGQTRVPSLFLVGTIVGPQNAPMPYVRVLLKSAEAELETTTGASGEFRFGQVAPGNYELHATVPGFEPVLQKVRVGARSPQPLKIRLNLASLKERMDVSGEEQAVSSQASSNADTISVERTMLDNLPFLDLNYLSALGRFLDPGTPGGAGTSIIVDGMEMRNAGVTAALVRLGRQRQFLPCQLTEGLRSIVTDYSENSDK